MRLQRRRLQFEGRTLIAENMWGVGLLLAVLRNSIVQTQHGDCSLREHFATLGPERAPEHDHIYRCSGCRRLTCGCNGGASDPRCDTCVVNDAVGWYRFHCPACRLSAFEAPHDVEDGDDFDCPFCGENFAVYCDEDQEPYIVHNGTRFFSDWIPKERT